MANLTRRDGLELLRLAAEIPIRVTSHVYALERANEALASTFEASGGQIVRLVPG